jgi:hypothetical protein
MRNRAPVLLQAINDSSHAAHEKQFRGVIQLLAAQAVRIWPKAG